MTAVTFNPRVSSRNKILFTGSSFPKYLIAEDFVKTIELILLRAVLGFPCRKVNVKTLKTSGSVYRKSGSEKCLSVKCYDWYS